ncbi:restriction endonuclease subunit S [Tardiphaga sp. vice304]|uniref:restriction endonuclease subunit S n=1 Tax=Tardiphaga sp. vice304 TaxID=2592817 RepID=UPI00143DC808|nr:restriction endonuclease subunit S [Tardiphaga sp. vice304]
MPAVRDITGEIEGAQDRPFSEVSKGYTHFQTGDVIFAKITPCMENGKIAVARKLTGGLACGSTEFHVLRPLGDISPDFIWRFLRQKSFRADAEAAMTGAVGQRRVPLDYLKAQMLPLPPLNEQRRIVKKIDGLTAQSRYANDHLNHIPRLVEKYKQAILAAAFRGDLTRGWRSTNKNESGWEASTIGDVATIASGQTPKGIEDALSANGEISWFKVSSMNEAANLEGLRSSQFRLSRNKAMALGLRMYEPGSITFPKRGGAIATNKKRRLLVAGALDLNLMVLTARKVTPEFLWWWMDKLDLSTISNGSNVPQINNGDIAPLAIQVPPIAEQNEICRRIQAAVSWIDRLVTETTSARKLIVHLDQAILAKAFRGELVPQDPNDEPASVLLERNKAERAGQVSTKRSKRARK